ncbi:MAG TPA: PPOX class F420-dependent oxidoreductase [Acidimicrobiales bacterium]|nr:PPOX class F420-dependent oxidoreductase [Acidimicrobiales bacterium]
MFDETTRELLGGKNFAAFTTVMPDGKLSTQMMWVDADETHVLINTETGRQKYRNVKRDPRVTVMVFDPANPYRYSEIRGRVVDTVTGPKAREHVDKVSHKYTGGPYANPIATERVILRIEPERVRSYG